MPNFVFHNVRVGGFSLDHLLMRWEVQNQDLDPYDYSWYIERSESPMGPFDTLAGPFSDRYQFLDHELGLMHRWRKLYYRVRSVRNADTSDVAYSEPTAQLPESDLIALEIRRLEEMIFRTRNGRKCWLFPVRTFGMRCDCFDPVLYKVMRDNCPSCYQTGFAGGYMHPIECWVQIDPSAKSTQRMTVAEAQQSNTTARLSAFPPVRADDILVEAENRRWVVASVTPTERLRATVQQQLVLHEIVPGDIEFALPINVADPLSLQASAEENFGNAQNLEAFERGTIRGMLG